MNDDIRLRRRLDVTPDVAFHHWVDAEERRRWYQGDEPDWVVEAATDLRVGGHFYVRWGPTSDRAYQEDGIFRVVDPPHRLVYTSRFTPIAGGEEAPLELLVTVTFQADQDGTLLELIESGYPTPEIRDAFLRNGADQGLAFYERTFPPRHGIDTRI
jgi:uncharacterized protein YndB with AHSA1/START domain